MKFSLKKKPPKIHKKTIFGGHKYVGELKGILMHGKGELFYTDGSVYKGGFNNGLMHGKGVLTKYNGDIYTGKFKNHEFHGYGELTKANGTTYKGQFKEGKFHGQGEYVYKDIKYSGKFKENRAYLPNTNKRKKKQTILTVSHTRNELDASFYALKASYNKVVAFDRSTAMNADLLKKLVTTSTKEKKNKIKVLIDEHGSKTGKLTNQNFVLKTLDKTLKEIKAYNIKNPKKPITNIDITLNSCYGSKTVYDNQEFQKRLKNYVKEDLVVKVSASDEKFTVSNNIVNNKNALPVSKNDDGFFVINDFLFDKKTDFNAIKPYKVKKYRTTPDFLMDNYVGKKKTKLKQNLKALSKPLNSTNKSIPQRPKPNTDKRIHSLEYKI